MSGKYQLRCTVGRVESINLIVEWDEWKVSIKIYGRTNGKYLLRCRVGRMESIN